MRRDVIKIGAITIVLLIMLNSLALAAADSSFMTRLFNWLRSNISVFRLKEQRAESAKAGQPESRITGHPAFWPSGFPDFRNRSTQTAKLLKFYNYPNPFIPDLGTDFICELEGEATLELKIFGMDGSLVKKLNWGSSASPPHWDGKDTIGRTVRTGMYIYALKVTDAITGEVADLRYGKMMAWYTD